MNKDSNIYIIGFAAAVCAVCSVFVSSAAVSLKDQQDANAKLDLQKNVVSVSGFMDAGAPITQADVDKYFDQASQNKVQESYIELSTGELADTEMAKQYLIDNKDSCAPPEENPAKISCLPKYKKVYQIYKDGVVDRLILEVEGKGLWSTLYGFLAMSKDGQTVQGITFYKHGETPGLGGEVDNPKWKAEWEGKKAFNASGEQQIDIKKGPATPGSEYEISGLSGATLTSNGVEELVSFWLGDAGYGKFLKAQKGAM